MESINHNRPTFRAGANKVLSAIKTRKSLEALLQNPKIPSMTDEDFAKWISPLLPKIETGLSCRLLYRNIRLLMNNILTAKNANSSQPFAFVCREPGYIEGGIIRKLPKYDLSTRVELAQEFGVATENTTEIFTKLMEYHSALFQRIPTISEPTEQNIQAAFEYIKARPEISWNYHEDGCYARADESIDYLCALGFEKKRLSKVVMTLRGKWSYHMAAGIIRRDGTCHIIDPSNYSRKALELQQWADLFFNFTDANVFYYSQDLSKPPELFYSSKTGVHKIYLLHPEHNYYLLSNSDKWVIDYMTGSSKQLVVRVNQDYVNAAYRRKPAQEKLETHFTKYPKFQMLVREHFMKAKKP